MGGVQERDGPVLVGQPGCGAFGRGFAGRPTLCGREVEFVGTRWFGHSRSGYRIGVCDAHREAVDDPHEPTAADRAELDARAENLRRAFEGGGWRPAEPLWTGPREARPSDWADDPA